MRLDWDHLEVKIGRGGYYRWERGVHCSWTWQNRIITDNDIWLLDCGEAVMNMIGGKTSLNKNTILWLRPGHDKYAVDQNPDDPIGLFYIHFELIRPDGSPYYPSVEEMPETFECFNHIHWLAMGSNLTRLAVLEKQNLSADRQKDIRQTASMLLKSMLMGIDLCDSLAHSDNNTPTRSNMIAIQAAEYLLNNANHFPDIAAVARHFGLSRNRFSRIFTDFWHVSPLDYMIEQRISQAKSLLRNTNFSLKEIANSTGYSDRFYFSRQFKEKTGTTPGEYRALVSGKQKDGPNDQ